jgi:hypothetical protein
MKEDGVNAFALLFIWRGGVFLFSNYPQQQ